MRYPLAVPQVLLKRFWVVVKPFKAEAVVQALRGLDVPGQGPVVRGLVVSECRGYGRQKGHLELYMGSEYEITFTPKVRLEFVASAFEADRVVDAICRAARTGRIGDGKILISEVRATAEDYA
jgi:nitrogen regulatory protein PII